MADYSISVADLEKARDVFKRNESRGLFYRAATELVDLALHRSTSLTVAEALAVLLQTWNMMYYRFIRKFDTEHLSQIEVLLVQYRRELSLLRQKRIEDLALEEKQTMIVNMFESFETVLGPVGSAKALHLLAPRCFPLWDREIAKKYGQRLREAGSNGERYWQFMRIARNQCVCLGRYDQSQGNLLKALDEYNYCRYVKGWSHLSPN